MAPKHYPAVRNKKEMAPKSYRVLPPDLPPSERPPLPAKHHGIPVIGFVLDHLLGLAKDLDEMRALYGPIYRTDYFLFPQTFVTSYQGVSDILNDSDVFQSRDTFSTFVSLFGEDVLTQIDGAHHARERATLAPVFSPQLLPCYFKRVAERAIGIWERVNALVVAGKSVKLDPLFREHYLGIMIEITTGVKADSETAALLSEHMKSMQRVIYSPTFGPIWDAGLNASARVQEILADVVCDVVVRRANTINYLREYGDEVAKMGVKDMARGDVDLLLVAIAESSLPTEVGATLDPAIVNKLCKQMLILWFAGYTTSAVTSTCTSFELGWDDAARTTLVKEQDALVASAGGIRAVTYEQINAMPRLDAYINEILRTRAVVSGLFRRVACDVEMHGKLIRKGTIVFAKINDAHYDPDAWPDPKRFDPERFLRSKDKQRASPLLAFGGIRGPHYCIGAAIAKMMMKTTFATLLREYSYMLDPKQSRKYSLVPEEVPKSGVVVDKFDRRFR